MPTVNEAAATIVDGSNIKNQTNDYPARNSFSTPPDWIRGKILSHSAIAFSLVVLAFWQNNSALAQNMPDSSTRPSFKEVAVAQSTDENHTISDNYSTDTQQNIYAQVIPPNDPLGLLTNLKIIVMHDLLLREDFYTERNMQKLFGAESISIGRNPGNDFRATGYHNGYLANIVPTNQIDRRNSGFALGCGPTDNGKMKGVMSIFCIEGRGPLFNEVEEVFGKGWKRDRNPPPLDAPYYAPTGQHGNARIWYHFDDSGIRRSIYATFNHDGRVHLINITLEVR